MNHAPGMVFGSTDMLFNRYQSWRSDAHMQGGEIRQLKIRHSTQTNIVQHFLAKWIQKHRGADLGELTTLACPHAQQKRERLRAAPPPKTA